MTDAYAVDATRVLAINVAVAIISAVSDRFVATPIGQEGVRACARIVGNLPQERIIYTTKSLFAPRKVIPESQRAQLLH